MSISVIVPAFNEEKRIGKSLKKIIAYLERKKHDYEILVVDDGSSDRTAEIAEDFRNGKIKVINYGRNMGKGYAVKKGMLAAKKNYLLFSDADLSTPIEELDKFAKLKGKYDVIIGSRALKNSEIKIKQPFYRVLMGRMFNFLVRILAVRNIHDTQCGFKLFTRRAARRIFKKQRFNGFSFDVEILFIARKYKYRIKEVPITWLNSPETKVSPFKDSINMFIDVARTRLNDIMGKY